MKKTLKRSKRAKKLTAKRRRVKRSRVARGPVHAKCCMCGKEIDTNNGLIPGACYKKNGAIRAHRICSECWWNSETGFAREGADHRCPGCVKGLPLNGTPLDNSVIIDLTADD